MIRNLMMFALLGWSGLCLASDEQQAQKPEYQLHAGAPAASKELFDALLEKDRVLFDTVFNTCDMKLLASLVTDDFEFFHDKWGQTAKSGAEFVESIGKMCARVKSGEDFRARRELDRGSLTVHVIKGYGAMQMGSHRFYMLTPGKPDKLTEAGKFIDLWKNEDGQWKLARVISYDHQLAE